MNHPKAITAILLATMLSGCSEHWTAFRHDQLRTAGQLHCRSLRIGAGLARCTLYGRSANRTAACSGPRLSSTRTVSTSAAPRASSMPSTRIRGPWSGIPVRCDDHLDEHVHLQSVQRRDRLERHRDQGARAPGGDFHRARFDLLARWPGRRTPVRAGRCVRHGAAGNRRRRSRASLGRPSPIFTSRWAIRPRSSTRIVCTSASATIVTIRFKRDAWWRRT